MMKCLLLVVVLCKYDSHGLRVVSCCSDVI